MGSEPTDTNEENKVLKSFLLLECSICKNYLSVPPIQYNDVFGNICGRSECREISLKRGTNHPQVAYESVAECGFLFPCMYKVNGCQSELKWDEVELHEKECALKYFICPLSKNNIHMLSFSPEIKKCEWSGDLVEFSDHVEEVHHEKLLQKNLKLNLREDYNNYPGEIFFIKISKHIVVVLIYISDNKTELFFKVSSDSSILRDLQYKIKIFDKNGIHSVALKENDVEILDSKFFIDRFNDNNIKIDLSCMKYFMKSPESIIVEFELNGVELGNQVEVLSSSSNIMIEEFLKYALCFSCKKGLCPPVSVCNEGHNICANCKVTNECPECKLKFSPTRNIACEKLLLLWDQPCKNYSRGCLYKSPHPVLKVHEEICQFKPECPLLECDTEKIDNLFDHIKQKHSGNYIYGCSLTDCYTLCNKEYLYPVFIEFDNQVFLLTIIISNEISFKVECIGMKEIKYRYEVKVIDKICPYSQILIGQMCHPSLISFEHSDLKGLTNTILIPSKMLKRLISGTEIEFQLDIFKI